MVKSSRGHFEKTSKEMFGSKSKLNKIQIKVTKCLEHFIYHKKFVLKDQISQNLKRLLLRQIFQKSYAI